jgi:hypothetical protein
MVPCATFKPLEESDDIEKDWDNCCIKVKRYQPALKPWKMLEKW